MCGITGIFGKLAAEADGEALIRRMMERLRHRGPDDRGCWVDSFDAVALGHTRLSILDLSPAGHQPMESACGRYILSFNGEIYNFRDLASELVRKGWAFRGSSDTEVLLAAISEWGPRKALEKASGMFAFALWDRREKVLRLARDRIGEKPLYWAKAGQSMVFGSELKPIKIVPGFQGRVSKSSLAMLMRFNYIPAPHCIYEDAFKVRPGEMLVFGMKGGKPELLETVRYWDMRAVAEKGRQEPLTGSFEEAAEELHDLLKDSVRRQMAADVPLGAFLSGGIDSTLISALMQEGSDRKVKTFSIGFEWAEFNEAEHAKKVAEHLGTEHSELYVTSKDAIDVIGRLPEIYDEPFADSSQIPTFLLCQMARKEVTVALTGDGADELFFGYNRYFRGMRAWTALRKMPPTARSVAHAVGSSTAVDGFASAVAGSPLFSRAMQTRWDATWKRTRMIAALCGDRAPEDFYLNLISHERQPDSLIAGTSKSGTWTGVMEGLENPGLPEAMMYCDMLQYLPDDILVKVDRASMGVSLETRVPFLDHRICEFAWRLPIEYKYRKDFGGKLILKKILSAYVPQTLVDRPKMGFVVPIVHWLRKECRDWAESLLSESKLKEAGFDSPALILKHWERHKRGISQSQFYLWNVLAYMSWREANRA